MKVLQVRPDPDSRRNRWGDRVQVRIGSRWARNKNFHVVWCSYKCAASGLDAFEFVQLENEADCDVMEQKGCFWVHIAIGDVFRHCKICGRYENTMHGYYRRRKPGAVPSVLAVAWP